MQKRTDMFICPYEIGFFIQHANDGDLFIFRSGVHYIPLHFFSIDSSVTMIGDCIESNVVIVDPK
jgi:hypothetical protein